LNFASIPKPITTPTIVKPVNANKILRVENIVLSPLGFAKAQYSLRVREEDRS
jgi:hypothetical protein